MIIGFVGMQGTGKSLAMTFFAKLYASLYDMPIKSNMTIKDMVLPKLTTLSQLWSIRDSIICLDEVHNSIDSRKSADNVDFAKLITHNRKMRNMLFYTTQDIGQVDLRLRQNSHFIVELFYIDDEKMRMDFYNARDYINQGEKIKSVILNPKSELYSHYLSFEINENIKS